MYFYTQRERGGGKTDKRRQRKEVPGVWLEDVVRAGSLGIRAHPALPLRAGEQRTRAHPLRTGQDICPQVIKLRGAPGIESLVGNLEESPCLLSKGTQCIHWERL